MRRGAPPKPGLGLGGIPLAAMSKDTPAWLAAVRELCRANKIEIASWGANVLVVYAKTPERARDIAALLGSLGLQPVADPGDEEAGLLTLSPDPAALPH